jgi:cytochrome c
VCLFSTHDLLPDGRLASGGEDGKIKLWPDEGAAEPVILFHRSPSEVALLAGLSAVGSLAVLADGRLASGSKAGMIKLWPKEGAGEPVVFPNGGGAVFFLAALPDGRLASGGRDGEIKLWPKDGMGEPEVLSQDSAGKDLPKSFHEDLTV